MITQSPQRHSARQPLAADSNPLRAFVPGDNVIAIEVDHASATSTDLV
jgi:hypothetical protein